VGVLLGLGLGIGVSVLMRGLLFGLASVDVVTLGGSTLVLLIAAAAAAMVPGLRAVRVSPLEALRSP
jgi:ABC-type antimicrobial peptide transport system permease subunit